MGFSFGCLGHAQGWDLGGTVGVGGQKIFSPKFNQIWCVSYLHELHMQQHNFWIPSPWGLRDGSNFLNFLNMVMWHIKLKGMCNRPVYTEKI